MLLELGFSEDDVAGVGFLRRQYILAEVLVEVIHCTCVRNVVSCAEMHNMQEENGKL